MKFADFICVEAIQASVKADTKEGVIRELVQGLVDAGALSADESEGIVKSILKREELGSTGIGRGIAVPHTKHASVARSVGALGISHEGVDFNSLDGDKVNLFFLLVSPHDRPGDHLRALENVSRQLRNEDFCRFLKQSESVEGIKHLLDEADGRSS